MNEGMVRITDQEIKYHVIVTKRRLAYCVMVIILGFCFGINDIIFPHAPISLLMRSILGVLGMAVFCISTFLWFPGAVGQLIEALRDRAAICMMCDFEPCKCAEIYCGHLVEKGECVFCDERPHVILKCIKCHPDGSGGSWHVVENGVATCRRCETPRTPEISNDDIGIST
jgi:hypothetical protein